VFRRGCLGRRPVEQPVNASDSWPTLHELVDGQQELTEIMKMLLDTRRVLREQFTELHRKVLLIIRDNGVR
jgi:hypothetical protein